MFAVAYIRVSTESQANEGFSLDAQRARIEAWAVANDYTIKAVFVDAGISGATIAKRPAVQAAIKAVEKGDALVVYSLSRLSRSTRETLEIFYALDKKCADIVSLSEKVDTTSAAGRMVFRMMAVLSEFERDQLRERVKMGMEQAKAESKKVSHMVYGKTEVVPGEAMVDVPAELEMIQTAKALHADNMSLRKIGDELVRRGYTPRTGSTWAPSTLARLIRRG